MLLVPLRWILLKQRFHREPLSSRAETFSSIKIMKSVYISALFIGFVSSVASAETYPDLNGCYRCFADSCSNSIQYAKIVQNSPGDLLFYNERRPSLTSSGKFISENRVMAYSYRSNECGPPMIATLSYYPSTTLNWCDRSVWVKQDSCDWVCLLGLRMPLRSDRQSLSVAVLKNTNCLVIHQSQVHSSFF